MVAVGGCASVVPVLVALLPQATSETAAAAKTQMNRSFIDFLPPLVEHVSLFWRPGQPHRPALEFLGVAYGVHILTYRDQLLASIQANHVPGGHADVDHLLDTSRFHDHSRSRLLVFG